MNSKIRPVHIILLIINIALLVAFGTAFTLRKNYEFIIYVGVIIVCLAVIAVTFFKVRYSIPTLIGLTIWSAMHLSGGTFHINGTLLYELILIPLSQKYPILRYDQLVHTWGFAVATLTMFDVLRPLLIPTKSGQHYIALSIVVIMAGLGVGAFNEIVEALVAATVPESGVGDYVNTALDLIADLLGAILAIAFINLRYLPCILDDPTKQKM